MEVMLPDASVPHHGTQHYLRGLNAFPSCRSRVNGGENLDGDAKEAPLVVRGFLRVC